MKTIGVSELKTHCLSIVDEVARRGTSVLISKRGKIVARIIPAPDTDQRYPQDLLAGTVTTLGDIVSPLIPESDWNMLKSEKRPATAKRSAKTIKAAKRVKVAKTKARVR